MIEFSVAIVRLGLAIAFGAVIGVEREWRQKHAGLKTMALVSLGAATFGMLTDTFGDDNHNPGMLAAAVVGGIGFIGAGVIMHRGGNVQGVTTAATLWSVASVGVAVGLGQEIVATVLTAGILIVQFVMRWAETLIQRERRKDTPGRFELRVDCEGDAYPAVRAALAQHDEITVLRRSIHRGPEMLSFRAVIRTSRRAGDQPANDLSELERQIVAIEGVRKVDVLQLGIDDD